jgi:diguanylate cyclase (GGDEF)-like protein
VGQTHVCPISILWNAVFSSSNNNDMFNKYKQQTYRLAFPFGVIITILYVIVQASAGSIQFYFGIGMAVVLFLLSILVWHKAGVLSAIELVFYFTGVSYFFLMTYWDIESLIAQGLLMPETLADSVNSLGMWLVVFMVSGFLTLKSAHARLLMTYMIFGGAVLAGINILHLISTNQLSALYLFRWINPLAALMITILLIQRMGVLQQNQADTDSLTGLLNRRAMVRILEQELERSTRYKKTFSIIIFDVDNFKDVNDTFGHFVGDHVLRGISDLMRRAIRQTDSISRWGGEEFLISLPETELESAKAFAERALTLMRQAQIGRVTNVTASFGVAAFASGLTLDALLHRADYAMYQAKQNGRNQVAVYSTERQNDDSFEDGKIKTR